MGEKLKTDLQTEASVLSMNIKWIQSEDNDVIKHVVTNGNYYTPL